jgi:hypothetical protein
LWSAARCSARPDRVGLRTSNTHTVFGRSSQKRRRNLSRPSQPLTPLASDVIGMLATILRSCPESGWTIAIRPQEARNHSHCVLESSWPTIPCQGSSPRVPASQVRSVPNRIRSSGPSYLPSALPDDVRLMIMASLFCTLRISEVLGLQWRHIDLEDGKIMVRQRFYRGNLDVPKSQKAIRDVAMGQCPGSWPNPWAAER